MLTKIGNADQDRERAPRQPQSNNYHKARKRLGLCHLKVSRQRKDWSIKKALCVVASNYVVVYVEADRRAEGRPEDTCTWSKTIIWQSQYLTHHGINSRMGLEYYGKIWGKAVV